VLPVSGEVGRVTRMWVVIAEDAVLLREGLIRLLSENDFDVVAAVDNGVELVDAVVRERPDVSIVDIRMPPTFRDEGLRAAIEARRQVPQTPILVFSQYVEERYAAELLEGGTTGVGYLLKDRVADVREFVVAVRRVASGGTVLDPEVVTQLVTRRRRDERIASLTQREQDVLALMAQGKTNNAIADSLFVSEGTVEKHIRGIFTKLGLEDTESVHRRVLAVLTYLRLGSEEQ
jgi:DNA-binding NarL/FixJ family response regulator